MKRWLVIAWLFSWMLNVQAANESDSLVLNCGEMVQIAATPKPGYRFISWSDGVTDNPRWIDLEQDTALTAIFDHECVDPVVPVQALYDKLLLLDRPTLRQMGHDPAPEEVMWYRINGTMDSPDAQNKDDEYVGAGYYFIFDPAIYRVSDFYCTIQVIPPKDTYYCYEYLRSQHEMETGVVPLEESDMQMNGQWYNLLGIPVSPDYKGVIIQYGRKRLRL